MHVCVLLTTVTPSWVMMVVKAAGYKRNAETLIRMRFILRLENDWNSHMYWHHTVIKMNKLLTFFFRICWERRTFIMPVPPSPKPPPYTLFIRFYEKGKHNWVVGFITIESYLQKAFLSLARSANVWNAATFVNIPSGCCKTLKIVLNLYTVSHSLRARKCIRVWECIAFIFL